MLPLTFPPNSRKPGFPGIRDSTKVEVAVDAGLRIWEFHVARPQCQLLRGIAVAVPTRPLAVVEEGVIRTTSSRCKAASFVFVRLTVACDSGT
jgi:hypothetical protein